MTPAPRVRFVVQPTVQAGSWTTSVVVPSTDGGEQHAACGDLALSLGVFVIIVVLRCSTT